MGRNKFHATRVKYGSKSFPSKLEASVYQMLELREKAGEIKDIRLQHAIRFPCGPSWKVDFSFVDVATGETVFCEAKGVEVETYRIKKRMFSGCPVIENVGKLEVWKGHYKMPKLTEVIKSKSCGDIGDGE